MRRSKRIAVQVHLWLGLVVGLLWSIQGLTGSILVFHRELDRWAHPEWHGSAGPPLPADKIVAIAERHLGRPVTAIGILDSGRDLRTAIYTDEDKTERMLLLNAASGALLGERAQRPAYPERGSTSRFVYMVHQKLVSGETGETIIGISGVLLLSTATLGMWIAWPRRGNWKALVSPRGWKTTPQKLYSWHRVTGLVFGTVFIVVAAAGIYMTFSKSIRQGLGIVVPLHAPYRATDMSASAGAAIPAQRALENAEALFPGAAFVRLSLPTPTAPFYVVRLRQDRETRAWSGSTAVTLSPSTGEVLQVQDGLRGPLADRILDAQFSIHNGEAGGLAGRLLIMFAGLSLPTFYISGFWLWLRKRRKIRERSPHPSTIGCAT